MYERVAGGLAAARYRVARTINSIWSGSMADRERDITRAISEKGAGGYRRLSDVRAIRAIAGHIWGRGFEIAISNNAPILHDTY